MAVVDVYLYVGFVVGWLVGRWRPSTSPWVGRTTLASVVVLLGLLGASFRGIPPLDLASGLPAAIAYAGLLLGTTTGVYLVLGLRTRGSAPDPATLPPAEAPRDRIPTSGVLLASLLTGYGVGEVWALPTGILITVVLTILLALVGYGIELHLSSARQAWLPLASASIGALLAAAAFAWVSHLSLPATFATALGFGWYSLTGPLVAARFGATVGLFAFLTNFVREGLTMLLAPYVGRRLRGEGLAALGGATSMDTTLYFVVRYGDRRSGALSVASGLTLTVAASLVVPLVLAL